MVSDKFLVTHPSPVEPVVVKNSPWSRLAFDIAGPFGLIGGSPKYALVLIDYMSKWPEVRFVDNVNSLSVINFFRDLFLREGFPEELVSECGTQLVSKEMQDFLKDIGVKHILTSLYHPRSNGLVERFNCVIKEHLQLTSINGLPWREAITDMLWAVRTTPHVSTGIAPFTLLRGRVAGSKLNKEWMSRREVDRKRLLDVVDVRAAVQAKYDTRPVIHSTLSFKVGDWVRIKKSGLIRKGESRFSAPERVSAVRDHVVVLENGKVWNKCFVSVVPESMLGYVNKRFGIHSSPGVMPTVVQGRGNMLPDCVPVRSASTRLKFVPSKFQDYKIL